MTIKKFRTGDKVMMMIGKDRTRTGDIIAVDRAGGKVKVAGINLKYKLTKDGLQTKEHFVDVSNVLHVDANNKPSRVGFKFDGNKKIRFFKTTGDTLSVVVDYDKKIQQAQGVKHG